MPQGVQGDQRDRETLAKQMSGQKTQESKTRTPITKEERGHIKDVRTRTESFFERKETEEAEGVAEEIIEGQEHLRMKKEAGERSGLHQGWEGNSTAAA